jgi:amino acid adenylation domain-containing protein
MTEQDTLEWKRKALTLIERQRAAIEALEGARRGLIALIGLGCRLPGAPDPAAFWRLLDTGTDAVAEVPADRWDIDALYDPDPDAAGKVTSRRGGFVEGVDRFDADFFGISPREAASLDPQQRLLLEVSWEALEGAGLAPEGLEGSNTGVFVGIGTHDYASVLLGRGAAALDAYLGTGTSFAASAGRLSHVLGLEGPSVAVDTACSSSLVAVHQACDSLRGGQCDLALAGGVNALLIPEVHVGLSRARMLAPDGRCKTFDAAADGYVRGEGCGIVVLKRLADAARDGDPVLAVLRGSAVNHNGRSAGLPVPNGPAQQRVLRAALERAGVAPADVDYVEAHGTGTALGDPIEVQALAAVLGENRDPEYPFWVGSVKTNIGHLEAAAGITGLIKVVLALRHGRIPRQLHFRTPNPRIAWQELPVRVATEALPWAAGARRRIAGVSAFGFSGINAHVVVEEAPAECSAAGTTEPASRSHHLLALSARSPAALEALAGSYARWLEGHPGADLADVCFTAGVGRCHFEQRLAVTAGSAEEVRGALEALARGEGHAGVHRGVGRGRPRVAFLFTGQGSQYAGMARELYEAQPVFRHTLDRCADLLRGELPRPLLDVLWSADGAGDLGHTSYTQPCLFALEYALAELWRSWGVVPDVVLGHSAGEFVAACVAGVFTLEDGLRLIARRGAMLGALPPGGAMAAVRAGADRVRGTITEFAELAIAAENGAHTVLSGLAGVLDRALASLRAEGIESQPLTTSHAFHSPLVEPALAAFEAFAATVAHRPAECTLVSNVTGRPLDPSESLGASYWRRHAREAVLFAHGVQSLAELGCGVLLEVGPAPVLTGMARECWPEGVAAPAFVASLRRGRGDMRQLCEAAASLYVHGVTPDFAAWDRPWPRHKVELPTYPFQRRRHWPDALPPAAAATPAARPRSLLGTRQRSAASGEVVYATHFSVAAHPFLADHCIYDTLVVPGAAYAALALQAAGVPGRLARLEMLEPLLLDEARGRDVQVLLSRPGAEGREVAVYSTADAAGDEPWTLHARGLLLPLDGAGYGPEVMPLEPLRDRLAAVAVEQQYAWAEAMGVRLGPAFRGVTALWCDGREVLGEVRLPDALAGSAGDMPVHPAFLDACTQVLGALLPAGDGAELYLPLRYEQLDLCSALPRRVFCHGKGREADAASGAETLTFDIVLLDESGARLGKLDGLVIKRAPRAALLRGLRPDAGRLLYEVRWQEDAPTDSGRQVPGTWLVLGEGGGVAAALTERLGAGGRSCARAEADDCTALLDRVETQAGVVVLWGLEGAAAAEAAERVCADVLHLVQALARRGAVCEGGLWLCTRGSQAVTASEGVMALGGAALWGLGRVIASEYPNLRCGLLDLDPDGARDAVRTAEELAAELCSEAAPSQRALRGGRRFVPRLVRLGQAERLRPPESDYQLRIPRRGSLQELRLDPAAVPAPGPGQVQVRVRAAGLNFRDVLNALGLYPGEAGPLGGEWAGEVLAVGPGVKAFAPGDGVFGLGGGCFSSRTNVAAALAAPLPAGLGFAEAATVPVAFCTACYALERLAGLRRGQRVLIHAAAGGVGLAAVQLAVRAGAEVWATASEPKQAYLRSLGVRHVFNSRSTDFAGHIRAATEGRGVDVVLNSLTGEGFIAATLSVLAPGGHFVEIGKRDVWTAEQMRQQRPDVRYHLLALDERMRDRPGEVGEVLGAIAGRLAWGELRPLPMQVYPLTEAVAAFRHMQRARHVGKIVLSVPAPSAIRGDACYLVTGGLGALGLETARWLVRRGARHLVLAGRREPGEAARQSIGQMQEAGCAVRVVAADVAREDEVRRLLGEGLADLPPLRGVFHTAGVLDVVVLANLSRERLEKVLAPKVRGAWHLHEQTRDRPLDFFVLYSSIATLLGSPGQGNYAAANAFLDALAEHRRARGLPALSIAWGPWAGAGMAANVDTRGWQAQGLRPLRAEAALAALETALNHAGTAFALDADWDHVAQTVPRGRGGLLADVLPAATARPAEGAIRERLRQAPPEQRPGLVEDYLQHLFGRVLGATAAIDPDRGFLELGMDSLMALELRKQVEADLGIDIPISDLLGGLTVRGLAQSLSANLHPGGPQATPAPADGPSEEHPLSAEQAGLWVINRLAPDSAAYNVAVAAATEGVLDLAAFRAACRHLARRHPILRTTFALHDGGVVQRPGAGEIDVEILEGVGRGDVARLLAEDARRPFDLEVGPVCRVRVYRYQAAEQTILLTVHHAAGDFLSVIVLMEELLLAAAHPNRLAALPPAPPRFVDYVAWERHWLTTTAAARQLAYWRGQLLGELPTLALPTDRPRPAVPAFRGGSQPLALDPELVRQLRQLARGEGLTPYVVLLAAWATLLCRHTNQPEVVIGSPTLGRPRPEFARSVGHFVNTLPLRLDLSGGPTFRELLGRVRGVVYGALENADYPFSLLVRDLGMAADAGRSPLLRALFAYDQVPQNSLFRAGKLPEGPENTPGLRGEPLHLRQQAGQFDLSLSVVDWGDRLDTDLTYDADLFEPNTIAGLAEHFRVLLAGAVADPGSLVGELPLQSPEERRQVLVEWNDTRVKYPAEVCLHHLVESQVRRSPGAVAVDGEDERLTYRDLNVRANRLANAMRRLGVGPETLVGVCLERSADLVVALLATLKAGGAYVPLDPEYPRERLALMLQDAQLRVILTQERLLDRLTASEARVLCLDSGREAYAGDGKDLDGGVTADNPAYVIYTSGSTGVPKGVMNTHRGIVNRLLWMQDAYGLTADDGVLQKTPIGFDVSVWEFFWPLLAGARLVLARPGGHREPRYLAGLIARRRVTTAHFVPSMLQAFLDEDDLEGCRCLRRVLCSGEALPVALQERFFSRLPAELHNLYGPTEASVDVTSWACRPGEPRPTVPIGRPIANNRAYVLDDSLRPVPVGVAGELHLGGVGPARGYLNRPGLTAEKFIPDSFSDIPGARLYRTGDLARWLPDGNLEFLGRRDGQVKVRGNRIELGEIESVLAQHPGVRQAAVAVREDVPGNQRLVAYCVAANGAVPQSGDLRGFLQGKLPEYMVPAAFVPLGDLPLTPSGKLDRKSLPAPADTAADTHVAPRTPDEEALAGIWAEVVGRERVGVRDNFFDLGGHSLLAARLLAAVEKRWGRRLPLADLFRHPTVEGLARRLLETPSDPASVLVPVQPEGARPPFFCVHPSGGTVFCFAELAREMGPDQPFFGLQSRGLLSDDPPQSRIEDMAAHYLKEVRRVQPAGPYRLGGWSFGGVVAWEMAQQLVRHGESVAMLALLDATPPTPGPRAAAEDGRGLLWVAQEAGVPVDAEELLSLEGEQRTSYLMERARQFAIEAVGPDAGTKLAARLTDVHLANLRSLDVYRPQPYAGPVYLLRAQDEIEAEEVPAWLRHARQRPDLGWSALAGGELRVVEVPGHHWSMVRPPHVTMLARALRDRLDAVIDV